MGQGDGEGEGHGMMGTGEGKGHQQGSWNHGVFGCMSNCSNCLCGMFCPLCLICQNARGLDDSGCMYYLLACFVPCLAITMLRSEARQKYGIPGNTCDDALHSWCCGPCVNCQVANEIDHN